MKKFLFLIVALSFSFNCLAQANLPNTIRDIGDRVDLDGMQNTNEAKYAKAKGSPYLTDFFVPATIYPDDQLFFVKYNAVDDEIVVKLSATKTIVLDNAFKKYVIEFKENKERFVTLNEADKTSPSYFIEVKKTDNISLYKKQTKNYLPETKATDNYSKDKPARFSKLEEAFYAQLTPEGPVQLLPKKKKAFLALFKNNQGDVKGFVSKNKIKLTKEKDLVKLFTFLESL